MRVVFVVIFSLFVCSIQSQIVERKDPIFAKDTTSFKKSVRVKLDGETTYKNYKVISMYNDTTYIDTTLTINKEYKFNYIRKDNFRLLQFHNQGQTFTQLAKDFRNQELVPFLGATAKHYDYLKPKDIYYYNVATPSSEAWYKAGLEQGQSLDFLVTMNLTPQFNLALSYKGLRSLGKYRNALASHKNFKISTLYHSKNEKYDAKFHYYYYDLMNQENGGITKEAKELFENNEKNYRERGRLLTHYTDADSRLKGRRLFFQHSYTFFKRTRGKRKAKSEKSSEFGVQSSELKEKSSKLKEKGLKGKGKSEKQKAKSKKPKAKSEERKDKKLTSNDYPLTTDKSAELGVQSSELKEKAKSEKQKAKSQEPRAKSQKPKATTPHFELKLQHRFMYETKGYAFEQSSPNEYIGKAFTDKIKDTVTYQKITNRLSASSSFPYLGKFEAYAKHLKYNYFSNGVLHLNGQKIPMNQKGSEFIIGGKWHNSFRNLSVDAEMAKVISSTLKGGLVKGFASYEQKPYFKVKGYIEMTDKSPDFNKILYQSGYEKYNWYNSFKNENIKILGGNFESKWGNVEANFTTIHNYTYFDEKSLPQQMASPVGILKLKVSNEFTFYKFHLANTLMYQQVTSGASVYRTPKLITRNTLYFQDGVFKGDPLLLQVGVHFRYFTKYQMDAFNPVLNEFHLQNKQEIGDYPIFDFFVNGKIRQTRLYLKVENFAGRLTGFNYYSAPNHPYRDLVVRFGLVWNWFM
ncbi:MAG: putative porin [Flavobacteriaceae bacterium]|nr:putative porin [Flavobacteriaceae bacterium]